MSISEKSNDNRTELKVDKVTKTKTPRASNVELLRIIAITFVLILHTRFDGILSVYDGGLTLSHICRFAFEAFAIVGVNVFVMISGYFGIKLTKKSLLRYCIQVYYFALVAFAVVLISGSFDGGKGTLLRLVFPISHNVWFVASYFLLMLLAPMINTFIKETPLRKLALYTGSIYVITYVWGNVFVSVSGWGGYSWGFFIVLYLIGAMLRKWNESHITNKLLALFGYVLFSVLIIVAAILQVRLDYGRSLLWSYDCPLVIASSVCLFLFFSNLHIRHSRVINIIAGSTFAVLLFHMSPGSNYFDIHRQIYETREGLEVIGLSALVVVAYFIAAFLIDQPRKFISNRLLGMIK